MWPISALVEVGSIEEWTQKSWIQTPALPPLAVGSRAITCCLWASVFSTAGEEEPCFARAVEQILVRAQQVGALQRRLVVSITVCLHLGSDLPLQRSGEDSWEFGFLNFLSHGPRGLVQVPN